MTTTRLAQILQHEITEDDARKIRALLDAQFPPTDNPAPTAPYITRSVFGTTPEADCRLCGAHTTGAGIWAHDVVQDWVDDHAAECTPESVRVKARHLRAAANLLADHAEADPDDGTDWEHPAIRAAVVALRLRLQGTANRLAAAAHNAEETADEPQPPASDDERHAAWAAVAMRLGHPQWHADELAAAYIEHADTERTTR